MVEGGTVVDKVGLVDPAIIADEDRTYH